MDCVLEGVFFFFSFKDIKSMALAIACGEGSVSCVKMLVEQYKANVNDKPGKYVYAFDDCFSDDVEGAVLLNDLGAFTPLQVTIAGRRHSDQYEGNDCCFCCSFTNVSTKKKKVSKILLSHGADPYKGVNNVSPLADACDAKGVGVVRALLEVGRKIR